MWHKCQNTKMALTALIRETFSQAITGKKERKNGRKEKKLKFF